MVKRSPPIRLVPLCFFLLAAGGAWCQSHPSIDFPGTIQLLASSSDREQSGKTQTSKSLPDAPSSVRPSSPTQKLRVFRDEGIAARTVRSPAVPSNATALYPQSFVQNQSGPYRYSPSFEQDRAYLASTSSSLLGRTADAASGIFLMRDISGKRRVNTPYFLGLLASVVIQSAYRPSGTRSALSTFNKPISARTMLKFSLRRIGCLPSV